ncbi:hypothetical protein L3Q82_005557 [Scortum barcoo]|uniref:Uncharacterized protein n=1 Tax=Scortum barcoo TaxID=214431 RepID=A0ACB8VAT3_9TELE|nr:hypothetical protein L3Q82_005557 [Scortum barcoo]
MRHQLQTPPGLCRPALSGGLLHLQPEPESGKSSCPCGRLLVWFQSLKLRAPRSSNHFRPVALTSHLMKALERIVLRHLRPLVSPNMDPLQFAYQPSIGVDDAVIYLLQRSLSHLEDAGNTVRITFFDFSSAFNTIHPSLLRVKLERAGASDQLAAWVTNYLTDRPQFVRLQDCVSDVVVCSTEGNDCEYRKVIMDFVDWCELNHLQVNASKTKEMVIDFSRKPSADIAPPLNIQGLDIERVRTYKPLLRTFYETVVASVVSYAVVCWGGGCSERDKKRLNRLIKRASSVCGCPLDSIEAQIAFLQGERRGQENLKKDLVRRIKMLEYALKQERAKHHKLKYGTELNQGEIRPPSYDSDEGNDSDTHSPPNSSHQLSWKQGRQLLRQYLQEVGYTDTILDVKSQRVRALLGLTADSGEKPAERRAEPMVNGTEPSSLKDSGMVSKPDMSDSATVLEAFKFIESAAAEFSDEDEDEDSEGRDKTILDLAAMVRKKQSSTPSSTTSDLSDDPDTEEALKGFDFLASPDELDGSPESRSGEDSGEWGPNRSKLQDMLANLRDAEEHPSMQPLVTPPSRPSVPRLNEQDVGRPEDEAMTFLPSSGKSFILGRVDEAAVSNELGLGELAGLT